MGSNSSFIAELSLLLGKEITTQRSVSGGCIANAARIEAASGELFFVKQITNQNSQEMLAAEADGLKAMREHLPSFVVPELILATDSLLVISWIERGKASSDFYANFGTKLAKVHKQSDAKRFGWNRDNFIGATLQRNQWSDDWSDFWWKYRIAPQLKNARSYFNDSDFTEISERLPERMRTLQEAIKVEAAVPIHGDLWGGNHFPDENGEIVLFDPAFYFGHREAELAMTKMFGSYPPEFYQAYERAYPLQAGYWQERYPMYLLYHQLNHLNLFGASYLRGAQDFISLLIR